jgi:hypothetical protein
MEFKRIFFIVTKKLCSRYQLLQESLNTFISHTGYLGLDFFCSHWIWRRCDGAEYLQQCDSKEYEVFLFFGIATSITRIVRQCMFSHQLSSLTSIAIVTQYVISLPQEDIGWFDVHVTIATLVHGRNCRFELLPVPKKYFFRQWDFATRKRRLVHLHNNPSAGVVRQIIIATRQVTNLNRCNRTFR